MEYKVINFNFEWKIEKFFSLFENCNSIESPVISISAFHSIYFILAIEENKQVVITVQKSENLKLKLSECDIDLSDTCESELAFTTTIVSDTNKWIFTSSKVLSSLVRTNKRNNHLVIKCHMFFGERATLSESNDFDSLDLLKLSHDIRKLNNCDKFRDIKLQAMGDTFTAHKAILSARSPHLLKDSILITDASNVSHITNVSSSVFQILLKYIYCQKLNTPNFQLPVGFLKAVDELKLDNLKRKLSVYPNQIKLDTCQFCTHTSFTWSAENISSMKLQSPKRTKFSPLFQSSNENACQSEMSLEVVKLAEGAEDDIYFNLSLTYCFGHSSNVYFVKTKTSILDIFGESKNSQEYRFQVDKSKLQSEISTWVYRISKNDIDNEEEVLLPNDTLTFIFELCIYKVQFNISRSNYTGDSFPELNFDIEDRRQLSLDLEELYSSKEFSDLTFAAKGKEFKVHKIIIFARAPILLNAESLLVRFREITDIDPNTLDVLLKYLYTAKLPEMSVGLAMKLYLAAYTYDISLLKQRCLTYVKNNLVF